MLKNIIYILKTNKPIRSLLLVAIILFLASAALLSDKKEKINNLNSSSPLGYEEFTEKEQKNGDVAVNLAKEKYQKDYGAIRDTSFFYAELLSDGIYHVIGADEVDDRDVTFIEYDVNIETKSVKEIKPY